MTQKELQLLLHKTEVHRNKPKKPTKPGQNPSDLDEDPEELTPEEEHIIRDIISNREAAKSNKAAALENEAKLKGTDSQQQKQKKINFQGDFQNDRWVNT